MDHTQYNLTTPLCDAVVKIIQPQRITLKYSFHRNQDELISNIVFTVTGAGEILLNVSTMPTLKSCNYTRKINRDNSEVKNTSCNHHSTPCNLILYKICIARCSHFLDKNRSTCDN